MNERRTKRLHAAVLILAVLLGCVVMAFTELVWRPGYWIKSMVKLATFLGLPGLYFLWIRQNPVATLLRSRPGSWKIPITLAVATFGVLVGGYFLLRGVVDFSGISISLEKNLGITGSNFWPVALYILFVNSFLEELFFRGFAFLRLREELGRWGAMIFSAVIFAVYHLAILDGWFAWPMMLLLLVGLIGAGLLFNLLDEKSGSLWPGWLVHAAANLATGGIGMMLLMGSTACATAGTCGI